MRFPRLGAAAVVCVVVPAVAARARAQGTQGREVRGIVYDSLAAAPLAAAQVVLLDRGDQTAAPRSVKTDSAGRFGFVGVGPGTYVLGFEAPVLDSLGISSPTRLVQIAPSTAGTVNVDLAVPSGKAVHDAFCPQRASTDSTSALIGHLTEASTRGVIAGGIVQASWFGIARGTHAVGLSRTTSEAQSGSDGWFALCDLPAGMAVDVVAMAGPDTSSMVNVYVPDTRGLIRQEIYLRDPSAPHTGSIRGSISDALTHKPIAGARVLAEGASATSGSDGRFALQNVPYGTLMLTTSASGYQTAQQPTNVLAGEAASVAVPLLSNDMMSDKGRATAAAAIGEEHGFNRRKKTFAAGGFYSYDDLRKLKVKRLSEMFGMDAHDTASMLGFTKAERRNNVCSMTFYVDGLLAKDIHTALDLDADVPLESIAALEWYGAVVPPEFPGSAPGQSARSCATIVMWRLPRPLWGR